ncbi:NADPH-dependent methylglyoxal reductase Gre2p [Trichomonascus vanleenenianus]|uniref:NADPH-dependent methylglyoxal reductase Gre2p n=1 Tax=Trichomonascus vanleenenianus TaxID=2268995 RepID=UPI003EC9EB9E
MVKVLLTGATGFLALHVFEQLLDEGYEVVATIRSDRKLPALKRLGQGKKGAYVVEYVKDISASMAYDEVMRKHPDTEYIVHTASPFFIDIKDAQEEAIHPAINGTVSVLRAAKTYGKNVKRVVITSSIAANVDFSNSLKRPYTEKDYSAITLEQAVENNGLDAYLASKKFAELAAWEFMKDENADFSLTTIMPAYIFGPVLGEAETAEQLNESSLFLYNILKGNVPQEYAGYFVDVRDCAAQHILALHSSEAPNKRWYSVDGQFTAKDIVNLVAISSEGKYKQGLTKPDPTVDSDSIKQEFLQIDKSVSDDEQKFQYMGLKKSVFDSIQSFIDLGVY